MTDFETLLADRLNDLVDHETGAPQSAPPFIPSTESDSDDGPSGTRYALVAAVLLLVAGLTWASIATVNGRSGPQIAGPSTTVAPPTSSSPATTSPASQSNAPTTGQVGDMKLVLPVGWVVSDETYGPGQGPLADKVWCIDPAATTGACTIRLSNAGVASKNAIDVDIEGGWLSNPDFCGAARDSQTVDVADVRSFGGRSAEYRVWTHTCTTKVIHVEQYEVAYAPAWILYSEVADSTVSATMREIAQKSTLPAQTLPVRLADRGYVRSIRSTAAGYVIALDRIYLDPSQPSGEINNASTTYEYTVPKALLTKVPIVGDRVGIVTNGSTVTAFSFYGG